MSRSHHPPHRRRPVALVTALVLAVGMVVAGGPPAGATPAPLAIDDAIGIRVDEDAIPTALLDAIEAELQPAVHDIVDGAATGPGAPFGSAVSHHVEVGVGLSLAITPTGSQPGSFDLTLALDPIELEFTMDPVWPFAPCQIWVTADPGTAEVAAELDLAGLPDPPFAAGLASSTWAPAPDVTSNGVCWTYVNWVAISNWWTVMWNSADPDSAAGQIEALGEDVVQDLVDDVWHDLVVPPLAPLLHSVTFNSIRTDDHGLVVVVGTDATGGLTIPGLGGPFDVSGAVGSGSSADVDLVLASRGPLVVSFHPDVLNQILDFWHQILNGHVGTVGVDGPATEEYLLPPEVHDDYDDGLWTLSTRVLTAAHLASAGPDARPRLAMPSVHFRFSHPHHFFGLLPVATFSGEVEGVDLVTVDGGWAWVPDLEVGPDTDATLALDPSGSIDDVVKWDPDPEGMWPHVEDLVDLFGTAIVQSTVVVAGTEAFGGSTVDLCCSRRISDDRYTEVFSVT